eukprot:10177709-Ditylum_brightwellii.AAC.1
MVTDDNSLPVYALDSMADIRNMQHLAWEWGSLYKEGKARSISSFNSDVFATSMSTRLTPTLQGNRARRKGNLTSIDLLDASVMSIIFLWMKSLLTKFLMSMIHKKVVTTVLGSCGISLRRS